MNAAMADLGAWEAVIGLEVHAQLLTRTKAFCACATSFGDPPNTHTCPVCLGLPGALPVLNAEAARMAVRVAIALGCTVAEESVFARKNYFYPDLPKGYQISQYDRPLAVRGALDLEVDGKAVRAGITRVHMEEDAGKNVHGLGGESIVDLNRAGTPLVEIVGEPDLRSAAEAAEYLKRLREVLMAIGVNDGNLEQGSFRCDANVSVRRPGEPFGTRTELKNINSFRFVADAIDVEIRRQIALLEAGERVRRQTRGYHSEKRETYLLRDKESEADYRYFPEPDLPPLVVSPAMVEEVRAAMPELPAAARRRLVDRGLTPYAAGVLTSHPRVLAFFDEASRAYGDAVKLGNFVQAEVLRDAKLAGLEASFAVSAAHVAELLALVDARTISGKQAKEVYALVAESGKAPGVVVKERKMAVMNDEGALLAMATALVAENPKQAAGYRAGKTSMLGFFVGQIMKQTGGSADPAMVNAVLKRVLDEGATSSDAAPTPVAPIEAKPAEPKPAPAPAPPVEKLATPPAPPAPPAPRVEVAPTSAAAPPTAAPSTLPTGAAPSEKTIPFDHFLEVDIRVGLIVAAAKVHRKDKLLDLKVDVGDPEGPRRIVAGLALSFAPEALVGQRVLVLCNLEPRAFSKDLVSHGMILAAGPSDALALSTVTRDVPPGTKVK
jgi:aspartyl-tRNA(Asn)/glutamyl-tRNA(Gln) amidotransferase subunit B